MARSGKFDQFEDQIELIIRDLDRYSYQQLLGVKPDVGPDLVLYTYHLKLHEYQQVQRSQYCGAALHQHLSLLLHRLEEACEVLGDRRLAREYRRHLTHGITRHPQVAASRPELPESGYAEPLTRIDQAGLDQAAKEMVGVIDERLLCDPTPETEETDLGPIDPELLQQTAEELEADILDCGVKIRVEEEPAPPTQHAPIAPQFLDEMDRQIRDKLLEFGVNPHVDVEEERVVAVDDNYADAAIADLGVKLAEDGVFINEPLQPDEPVVPVDAPFLDRLISREAERLIETGVSMHNEDAPDETRSVDSKIASRYAETLEAKLDRGGIDYRAPTRRRATGPRRPAARQPTGPQRLTVKQPTGPQRLTVRQPTGPQRPLASATPYAHEIPAAPTIQIDPTNKPDPADKPDPDDPNE